MKIDLVFVWVVQIYLISVWDQIELDFSLGMKLIWLLCGRSKLTWFLNAGRKSLVVSVSTQVDLYFVWVVQIVLISVLGSNLT